MKFPVVSDIATVNIISLDDNKSLLNAIELMTINYHRNIVVIGENNKFSVLNILDIIKFKKNSFDLSLKLRDLNLKQIPTIEKDTNILNTLGLISKSEFICATNKDGTLYGLVTHSDITSNIDPDTLMENYRLKDFFKISNQTREVNQDEILSDILDEMALHNLDNIVIVNNSKPIGILTTKDVINLIKTNSDMNLAIKFYMSSPVDTIENHSSIKKAIEFIKNKHYKRVVVVDESGLLVGVINQSDLISLTYSRWAALMKEYQQELSEINNMLENKNKEFEYKASTDYLTGLYNRFKFSELFVSSYRSMIQRDNKMSLIMLDIDFFKSINDKYGHNAGDDVLVQISHVILRTLRNIDIVSRWGGEEFLMLLPTADLKNAYKLAQKVRTSVEALKIDGIRNITVSLGVCEVHKKDTMEEAIKRADDALYLAKNSGRNCVKTQNDL